jgi:hypothetical protein
MTAVRDINRALTMKRVASDLNSWLSFLDHYYRLSIFMDIEWLLSTLFDASLLSPSSRRQRRLFFCSVSGHSCPDGYHFVNIAAERLDRFAPTRSYRRGIGVA